MAQHVGHPRYKPEHVAAGAVDANDHWDGLKRSSWVAALCESSCDRVGKLRTRGLFGWRGLSSAGSRFRIPVCSTTRVKSAIVFFVDGRRLRQPRLPDLRLVAAVRRPRTQIASSSVRSLIIGDLVPLTFAVCMSAMHRHFVPIDA